jgi:AcrR family transcriptional regulator
MSGTAMTRTDDPTRTALLAAAHDLLASEGAAALTVRGVAARAGMSTMNVYSRFGGKDGLVDELFSDGFRRLQDAMRGVRDTDDPLADLRSCGVAYRRFARENPTYYAVMFQRPVPEFEPSIEAQDVASGALDILARRLGRAMDAGALTPADPLATAASVWATCHGLVSLELADGRPHGLDWELVYERTVEALLRGLGARAASG